MKRYRVCIKNAKECRIELTFADLCVKYTNGFSPTLKIKEGEEIPLDVCDPEDIRKSWLVGSLRGYLENKWIEEIQDDKVKTEPAIILSQFISEQSVLNSLVEKTNKQEVAPILPAEVPPQSILPVAPPVVEQKSVSVQSNEAITDLNLVRSYEDFSKLTHILKLRFIKETENLDLLRDITGKTTSSQLKNNIALRLSLLKVP
jgi:hypothetical protein